MFRLQLWPKDIAIPHQSQISSEEPICDSFPPGEALGIKQKSEGIGLLIKAPGNELPGAF